MNPKPAPGTYKLSRDVQNPHPDRRTRHDWRKAPIWKAGTEFVIRTCSYGDFDATEITSGRYTHQSLLVREAESEEDRIAPRELLGALEVVTVKDLQQALREANLGEFLLFGVDRLVRDGKLTTEQVVEAIRRGIEEEPEVTR